MLLAILVILIIALIVKPQKTLNRIKTKKVGDGQHGTARFASAREMRKAYVYLPYEPNKWRWGESIPEYTPPKAMPHKKQPSNTDLKNLHDSPLSISVLKTTNYRRNPSWL